MAWFAKPKDSRPPAPARCARCHEGPGTAIVRFVAAADAPPLSAADRMAWLCDACQAEVSREAGNN